MDFATAGTELNLILGDTADTTFSPEEKTRALTKAWNDSFVVNVVWDSSLTYTRGVYQYALPAALTTLKDIFLAPTGSTQPYPEPIDNEMWDLVNRNIQFNSHASRVIPNGYVLYLKGNYKLATTDSLSTVNMQEYVLSLAGVNTLTLLTFKKANLFLKNDTSMSELIGLRRELQADVKEARTRLLREYESA